MSELNARDVQNLIVITEYKKDEEKDSSKTPIVNQNRNVNTPTDLSNNATTNTNTTTNGINTSTGAASTQVKPPLVPLKTPEEYAKSYKSKFINANQPDDKEKTFKIPESVNVDSSGESAMSESSGDESNVAHDEQDIPQSDQSSPPRVSPKTSPDNVQQLETSEGKGQSNEASVQYFQCDACRDYPLTEWRYHCLECADYDLCSNCYETGTEVSNI